MTTFTANITSKWDKGKFVCVGLDNSSYQSNKVVIDQTIDLVCSYKPNSAFYEAEGVLGLESLKKTIEYIHQKDPAMPVILDAKRGDIENTNEQYAKAVFDNLGADGVTVHPYLGKESLKPFLDKSDKGIFVLIKTSNPGAGEFQDLQIEGKPLYQVIAQKIADDWNTNGNIGVVVGATYPSELEIVRKIIGDMPMLIPGIGAQGGDIKGLKNALDSGGKGIIVSSSRSIIFSENPRETTLKLHNTIGEVLK